MGILETKDAPTPIGPYSQGVEINGLLFLSGQIGLKPGTGALVEGLTDQTHQVLKNIDAILESAGCTLASVVKTTVYLRSMKDFPEFNEIYAQYFRNDPPARTTVEVSSLPRNALIEIEVVAHK